MDILINDKSYNKVMDAIALPIFSESARKRILSNLTLAYENTVRKELLNLTIEDDDLYWEVPNNLHHFNTKRQNLFSEFASVVEAGKYLFELRNEIKALPLQVKDKTETALIEEIKNNVLSELKTKENSHLDVSKKLDEVLQTNGMCVSVGGHMVHTHKASFPRFFWYLNGEVTALSKIMYIAEQLKKQNS